jgi:DNA (cytosine-5)-methyltransferase 1
MNSSVSRPAISAVDLFCGAGGLTHGLIKGRIEVRAGFDSDPACKFPFETNNSAVFVERDVKKMQADEIREYFRDDAITLLAGCAPCQPFSSYSRNGRNKGQGQNWVLVSEFGRLVKDVQPDLVTMENVARLASHEVFAQFLSCLEGYSIHWSIVECSALGVPQSRKRLVLLASRFGDSELTIQPTQPNPRTVRDTIANLPRIRAGETDLNDRLHTASRLSSLNMRRIRASKAGGTWRDWDESLRAFCHVKETGSTYPSVYGRMQWDDVSPTITTQCFGYGNGRFGHPDQDRAISLREAAMLQTFPRSYAFVREDDPVRFNKLGRLIGNAVPVRVAEVIADTFRRHVVAVHGLE